jgi:hypothetical protein
VSKVIVGIAVFAMLSLLAFPAFAQSVDVIFPEVEKISFDHAGDPEPEDHAGNPVTNPNPVSWYWHPGRNYYNVAGIQFVLKYDPYEADIIGITGSACFDGHWRFDAPGQQPPTAGTPAPASSVPGQLVGTVWVNHTCANTSGLHICDTTAYKIFDLTYMPKHTSHVSEAQFNTELDIVVSELRPIYHVTESAHTGSIWQLVHNAGQVGASPVAISESYLQHLNSISGKWVPNSAVVFGPLTSASAPDPTHVLNSTVVGPSGYARASESSAYLVTKLGQMLHWGYGTGDITPGELAHLPGTVTITGMVINPSSFYVGDPVVADHEGLGIDHVPEPVTLALLGLGGIAAFMRKRSRTAK